MKHNHFEALVICMPAEIHASTPANNVSYLISLKLTAKRYNSVVLTRIFANHSVLRNIIPVYVNSKRGATRREDLRHNHFKPLPYVCAHGNARGQSRQQL